MLKTYIIIITFIAKPKYNNCLEQIHFQTKYFSLFFLTQFSFDPPLTTTSAALDFYASKVTH